MAQTDPADLALARSRTVRAQTEPAQSMAMDLLTEDINENP